jgi:hypothetical protein
MLHLRIRTQRHMLGLLFVCLASSPAHAVLGEPAGSAPAAAVGVGVSVARATALRASLAGNAVLMRETLQDDGVVVQEYANAAGIVFAIAWRGPGFPDLKTLLGSYFGPYKAATELPGQPRTLGGAVQFERPGLVVRTLGRMRSFAGVALASDWVPPGVAIDDLLP